MFPVSGGLEAISDAERCRQAAAHTQLTPLLKPSLNLKAVASRPRHVMEWSSQRPGFGEKGNGISKVLVKQIELFMVSCQSAALASSAPHR
jgi:hypothetical protein